MAEKKRMDKQRGKINVTVSIVFRIALLVGNLLVRRFVIRYVGNAINGLDSLYTSLIGFLSVAELGVGVAITFCMYKPVVEGDSDKVSALYCLYAKIYILIGCIVFVAGMALMPFLKFIAKDYRSADVNLYVTFALMLISVVVTYFFSAKISLFSAYKNDYISTVITSSCHLLQYGLQIIVLFVTGSFEGYLICRIAAAGIQWIVTEIIARKKYGYIIKNKQRVNRQTKAEVLKNARALFMHKIGSVFVNTADSIIISAFIGVVILGKYSNYTVIMTAMVGTIVLFFTPLTSVIGHMYVEEDKDNIRKYYNFFYILNFIIGVVFFLGYYAVIDNLISVCFDDGLELAKTVSFVITVNYFIQFMRQSVLLFKDATGTFYNDRWKPLVEGLVNVVLSVLFVLVFPQDYKVVGVIVATIITNLFICHIVEPYVLYKYAFHTSAKKYYIRNYGYIAVFTVVLVVMHFCMITNDNQWVELLANGGISLAFSLTLSAIAVLCDRDFRRYFRNFIKRFKNRKAVCKTEAETGQDDNQSETVGFVSDGDDEKLC